MSTPAPLPPLRRLVRSARERVGRGGDDGGFMLMEVMVALTLITVIMAAVGAEYANGIMISAHQRSATSAAQVATSAMSDLRSLDSSDLLKGRRLADVNTQRDRLDAVPKIRPFLGTAAGTRAYNDASASGVPVPTTAVDQAASGTTFRVEKYLECQSTAPVTTNADGTTQRACGAASGTNTLRAVVAVLWSDRGCPSVGCAFVSSSLIDTHANPTFDLNQKLPAAPVVADPGDQSVVVDDAVSLQLLVQDGKGAAPFTWALTAGSLPNGLSLSPAGLISGTVAGSPTSNTSTVTVTDAFLRKADAQIKWTVGPRLAFADVDDQSGAVRQAVNVTVTATGGSGSGYSYTDPGRTLPAGLSLDASTGRITGSPTTVGVSNVTLTVTDSASRTATVGFTWTVDYPPVVATNPGTQVATVGRPEVVQLAATGGSGSYSYAATALPNGLSVNASTGRISGTPTATGSSSVTVTVTDTVSRKTGTTTFTLNVVPAPIVTAPGTQTTTKGGTVSLSISSTCGNGPCTYTASGLPSGLSIDSSTGRISGNVASNAVSTTVRVTATDAAGGTGTSAAFSWTINNAPTAAALDDRTTSRSTAVNVGFAGTFSGGTSPYTYSATGLPSGLSINASTGVVTGTTGTTTTRSSTRITVTDASGQTASAAFTWYVSNLALSMPSSSIARGSSGQRNLATSPYTTGGTTPYSYDVDNLPPGFTLSGTTVSGAGTQRGTWTVVVTVTDSFGASVTTNWSFTVT
ncbi:putative Ig domain-containing protein [Solicola sp. PLA-1-18]|uniref:putative Ig domain-containing protein n=1 Tax=Solicola sp. PLA-1-18 TaxID=3380532 RepID=UPI003B7F8445